MWFFYFNFFLQIIPNFYPSLQDQVKVGINTSLRHILKMRVLSSLGPLFDSPKLDRELRNKVRMTFKEFCSAPYQEGKNNFSQFRYKKKKMIL